MSDGQQTPDGTTAGVTTPVTTSIGSDLAAVVADLQRKNQEWENRYNGQQGALTKKANEVRDLQARVTELSTEYEGFKGTHTATVGEWEGKYKSVEQQLSEQSKKLATYELTDKVRSLVHGEFKDLAPSFESDPIYRAGILAAAQQMDEAGLKKALTDSATLRKGQAAAAVDLSLSGSTTPPPQNGAPAGETEEQLLRKVLDARTDADREKAMSLLIQVQSKKP